LLLIAFLSFIDPEFILPFFPFFFPLDDIFTLLLLVLEVLRDPLLSGALLEAYLPLLLLSPRFPVELPMYPSNRRILVPERYAEGGSCSPGVAFAEANSSVASRRRAVANHC
jgi:hypothetical protein